ncbi:hypothetical protein [Clostridium sp. ZBS2]|uniref:hypothetical protein n=1 Tax=Clostridium sp. ZBS2 TaxID=2949976 RepID=UPI00207A4BE6|nr:hypothetical protein [Clostridium sp. ZBS2]
MEIGISIGLAVMAFFGMCASFKFCQDLTLALDEVAKETAETLVQGKALIESCISGSKEDVNCDIQEMTNAVANSAVGNAAGRLCDIINITQNDMRSSAVDKCWAPEVSGPSIEVFPAHNDEGIIITDIPVTEVPSITILDTPIIVETPNNVEVFPEQRVDIPIIIDFPTEKQNETGNVIFIDGAVEADIPDSPSSLQKEVERGRAPKDVDRVDKPHVKGQKPHVHLKDKTSLNNDGTIHDKHRGNPNVSNKVRKWLENHGWRVND